MRVGIYGGSFNPIHNGHINVAFDSLKMLLLDKLILVPTNISPHKKDDDLTLADDRLNMCKRAVRNFEKIEVSDMEIIRAGISFTIDTLKELKKTYPNSQFFLIVGTDMFLSFKTWKKFEDILKLVTICVVPRNISDTYKVKSYAEKLKPFGANIKFLNINVVPISSTEIRRKLKKNENVSDFLPLEVIEYIKTNNLYRVGSETNF